MQLRIADFSVDHIEQAMEIAKQNYEDERRFVSELPIIEAVPHLKSFAENRLGVVAFSGEKMVGFLSSVSPFPNCFSSTDAIGAFSPLGANGAIGENRATVYAGMYQAAAEKWVKAGATSHGICLYSHDKEVQEQFYRYGFGLRCIDALRNMEDIPLVSSCPDYEFRELNADEFLQILPLDHMLDAHMAASPCFILRSSESKESFLKNANYFHSRYIVAKKYKQIVAYIRAEIDGENFICETPEYIHVKGAFCLPNHRGNGIFANLLNLLIQKLRAEGYTRLGVDFESINPAAYGFWLKYFSAYTHSVVRRIDEHVIIKR